MNKISIITPVFNEEIVISEYYNNLTLELNSIATSYQSEIIFILDGCTDNTFKLLTSIAKNDYRVKIISLSRRYGHQNSIIAGMDHAEGDIIIMMDSDMQHPPKLIFELLSAYESGYEIVHAVRNFPKNNKFIDRFLSNFFYKCINLVSDVNAIEGAADYRLITKKVNTIFKNSIRERSQFLRGLFIWVGFKQCTIPYFANNRVLGGSKYNFFRKIDFALTGLISFNIRPLKILTLIGFALFLLSILFGIFVIFAYFLSSHFPPGWSTIIVIICLFGGIQLFFLGIICQYLASINIEVKNRPIYIVESKINF